MSALLAPQRSPGKADRTPRLRPIPDAPRKQSSAPFIGLVAVVLGAGMGGAILLNTVIEQQSRELVALQRQVTSLTNEEAMLTAQADMLRSPRVLALKAADLGMVPNPNPVYIKLPNGEILGTPTPITGTELPDMVGAR